MYHVMRTALHSFLEMFSISMRPGSPFAPASAVSLRKKLPRDDLKGGRQEVPTHCKQLANTLQAYCKQVYFHCKPQIGRG